MTSERPTVRRWVAACLVVSALTGCSAQDPSRAATASADRTPVSAAKQPAALAPADSRACAGVEAVIGHITVDTARWSPRKRPFDAAVSARLSTQTRNLAAQASLADGADVRAGVDAMAAAFGGVATAMRSRRRAGVEQAIARSQAAYKVLKRVCQLADD